MRRFLIFAALTAVFLAGDVVISPGRTGGAVSVAADLQPGDVVFISVPDAFWAQLASRWSLPQYRHGHVGMVVEAGARGIYVVHAGGSPTRGEAKVKRVALTEFVREAARVDVFRPVDAAAAAGAAEAASEFAAQGLPFDGDFSLETVNKLYCTEMIWRALGAGFARDILPKKSLVAGRRAVLLRDIEASPFLRPIRTANVKTAASSD